jgi:hypothetical protein
MLLGQIKALEGSKPVGPRTYEMNLRARPEELLDWDKSLGQQSPYVQERLQSLGVTPSLENMDEATRRVLADPTGNLIYGRIARKQARDVGSSGYSDQRAASQALADAGIPGIRYLDEGSRGIAAKRSELESWLNFRPGPADEYYLGELSKLPRETYNYVGTDPSRLDILAKYGIAGALPLGALAAQDNYEARP